MRLCYKALVIRASFSLLLFLLLTPTKGLAVITVTYDNKSSSSNTNVSSLTWSHTTGTGSDRILIVGVAVEGVNINSVTYNGTNLTRLATKTKTVKVEMWYLVAPANGAHDVVVTLSGDCGLTGIVGGAQSFYNVDPTTPFGTTVTASGNSTAPSATVTSAVNEMVVDAVATSIFGLTVGGGQTQAFNLAPFISGAGSRAAGAASVTMDWSIGLTDDWATIAVPIKPAAVLPIKLYSFNAECRGNNVEVSWATASEINNSFFTVEKSANGEFFEQLATVQGSGNSSTYKNYQITDSNPLEGTSYYRLKQTDYNGESEYFPVVTIQNCSVSKSLQIFFTTESSFNPSMLVYKIPEAGEVRIETYNILGELMKESETFLLEPGTYHYIPFTRETARRPQNYVALFRYRNQTIPCRFIE